MIPETGRKRLSALLFAVIIALVSALMFSISAVCLEDSAYAKLTPENIKVGKKISGYVTISGSYDGAHSFTGSSWSGDLSIVGTRTVTCLNPSAASTPNGRHPYSAKITSIDKNKGKVSAYVTITPKGASGTARDPQGRLYGYQRAGGTITFDFSFKGDLVLTKTLSGSSGKSKIKGAKYGIYKTKNDAKKNKNALAKKTTDSHGQFTTSLTAGTYYVRELSVPWPYLVDEVPRKVVITGGKKTKLNVKDSKTPKITIKKTITLPNGAKSSNIIGSASNPAATVTSVVSGSEIITTIAAHKNLTSIKVSSATTSLIGAPKSAVPSSLSAGKTITVKQSLTTSSGWAVGKTHAYLCTVSTSSGKVTTSIALPNKSLAKTKYGIYTKKSCSASSRVGYITLKSDGTGTYGAAKKELLDMKTKYYIKEVPSSIAPGYTYNTKVYSVSTKGSNSTVVVKATDSFNTLSLTKVSRYPSYTSKYSQFSISGATYGVFKTYADAQSRSASRAVATVACNASGYASVTGLSAGTYYVSELPSKVTRPISGNLFGNASLGAGLSTPSTCKISSVPMGKFLVDETIHTVKLSNGTAASFTSSENIPVRIKIDKLSTRADVKSIPAFSLAGAVFGVYETRQAAEAAKVVRYGSGAKVDTSGAVAVIYGAADGTSVASKELPLRNYYVKEIQVPKSYSTTGASYWKIGNTTTTSEIREITVNDFLSSTRCADGILCTPVTSQRVNEPVVTITVGKSTPDLDNNIAKDLYDGMFSLSGAQFAVYRTQADAEADRNRISFSVDSGVVSYDNLVPGVSYTVVGTLVDPSTGLPIEAQDATGNTTTFTAKTDFTATGEQGDVTVEIPFNGYDMENKTTVVFERLYIHDERINDGELTLVGEHVDAMDENQSVHYPSISTYATDQTLLTSVGTSRIDGGVVDTVKYENLVPGHEYTITGKLVDANSGEELTMPAQLPEQNPDTGADSPQPGVDGNQSGEQQPADGNQTDAPAARQPITASTTFTPSELSGEVDVVFENLLGDILDNKKIVVFETLSLREFDITCHTDLSDQNQTVYYPSIKTSARDAKTETHEGLIEDIVTIVDTVTYENLLPGEEYTMSGTIMDMETREPLINADGNPITSTLTFTPEQESGSVELTFEIPRNIVSGKHLVAFERLLDASGNVLTVHEDIEDEEQTVSYPAIQTTAKAETTNGTQASFNEKMLIDEVRYQGLTTGKNYTLHAVLMDKETGEPVVTSDGTVVENTLDFVPADSDGLVEITLDIEKVDISGKTFVVFEELYDNESEKRPLVAQHKDIEDEAQTVHVPAIATTATDNEGNKELYFRPDASIIDTVEYHNLIPGQQYKLVGTLMNKETGDTLSTSGLESNAATVFTPTEPNGTAIVEFKFNEENPTGYDLVAFEELYSSSIRDAIRQRELAVDNRHDEDTIEAFRYLIESSAPDAKKKHRKEPKLYFQMDGDPEEPLTDEQLAGLLDMQYADTSLYSSLPLDPIESDADILRLLKQTEYLAVGRHYGAVALWLYQKGLLHLLGEGWDIEHEEPTRVLVVSPDFLSRSREAARAFEALARQIPVIYDERQGDGFEYDIEICNHNLFFVPRDAIVPDELAWMAAKVSNRIFARDLFTIYTHYDEPPRIRTISSWAMLEQDRIYLAMTLSRFGEDDPDIKAALREIEELSHKHQDILDKIINVSLFGKRNMSPLAWQATLSCDDAFQAWNNLIGIETPSLLFDALEMEASDSEIEALLKQMLDEFPNTIALT